MPVLINTWSASDHALKLIAQAVCNENGEITSSGTTKGDQNGGELCAVPWYQHTRKWGKVYRLSDATLAEKVAKTMTDAITNGWIGYDTWNRDSMLSAMNAAGGKIRRINTPCDTDCSALTYLVLKEVTGVSCEVDTVWLFSQMWSQMGVAPASMDDVNTWLETASSAQCAQLYGILQNQPTPSPYTDPYFPPFMLSATNTVQLMPKVRQTDYYMERVLPDAGIDVEVYTITNYVDGVIRDGTAIDTSAYGDNTKTYYLYETPFDSYSSAHLFASVSNNNEAYLVKATAPGLLQRGDILRTRAPAQSGGGGHDAIWI